MARGAFRTEPPARECRLGGVRALRFSSADEPRATVLHFHGGGLRLGCPEMIGPYATALADRAGVEVVCPAYRLAPEHPFPAGLNDAWRIACALRNEDVTTLIVAGDSAGGGIATSLTALLVAASEPPAGLLLFSPWLDLTLVASSFETNAATDPDFSRAAAALGAEAYLAGLAPEDPLASPLFGALAGFPPTFVSIGAGEVLADDGHKFVRAVASAGVDATLSETTGMIHAAVTRSLALPGACEVFEQAVAFVESAV